MGKRAGNDVTGKSCKGKKVWEKGGRDLRKRKNPSKPAKKDKGESFWRGIGRDVLGRSATRGRVRDVKRQHRGGGRVGVI